MFSKEEPLLTTSERLKLFFTAHWRGFLLLACPLITIVILLPLPGELHQWCAWTLIQMAVAWVTECLPLAITSFLPILVFPLVGIMTTRETCDCYMNDTIIMFLGSLILAYAVEQSGLHKRLAFCAIRIIGYNHYKLLFAICLVTTFVSMWITNTAATTMMVPINFAVLKVFEDQRILKIYEKNSAGEMIASDLTTCYFCAATFSATIGGIGTLVGTATNLAFKGLFMSQFPTAPEYLSFPLFSAFSIPMMICLEGAMYLYLIIIYLGFLRPKSAVAKSTKIPPNVIKEAKRKVLEDQKKLGRITFWEIMVIILFGGAMISFFCRSPTIFTGWGDAISNHFTTSWVFENALLEPQKASDIRDSVCATFVAFLMFLLPSTLMLFKNFRAKFNEDLPKSPVSSVLNWTKMNAVMPFSFMFLLGGGFALSTGAKSSGLNEKIGKALNSLQLLPNLVIILLIVIIVIFITNFASNVAVCNVLVPIVMQVGIEINNNPLWYNITAGITASFCFMLPVGTPGNLVVQSAASIPTLKMVKAGLGPTISTIIISWVFYCFYAPLIWPDLNTHPAWMDEGVTTTAAGGGGLVM